MEAIQLIQISLADLRGVIAEEIAKAVKGIKPVQVKPVDKLLTKREVMELIKIKSYSGLQAWCIQNKVYGTHCGKRKMYLESEVMEAFNR